MATEVLRAGTASVPIFGQLLERVTFGVEDKIAEEEYQRSVKELLKNLHDEISGLNVELSEADAFRVARRLIQTGQFSSIEEKLDSLSLAFSGFEMKFMAELRTLASGPDETQRIVAAEVAKLREQLNQDIRKFLSEEILRFSGVGRPHRSVTSELRVADLVFFQKLASYVRAKSKHGFDSYLVDATEIVGFVAPNDGDLQHFLPTACSLEIGPVLYVSSKTLIEISRVFEALRSRQGRLFSSGFGHRISKTELTTHHKKLISEAFQLHRFHYLMKQGRFEKLDESFLAPGSPLGEKFAAEYHSSAKEISRRKMHVQSASLDVDAFNVAILKVAGLAPDETGGTFGLITRDKALYGLDAANRKDSKILLPFLHPRAPVSTRTPSFRNSRIVRLTVVSPSSVCRWIVPFEHQMPEPSSDALSAKNMMICLRVALPNFRSAQAFATRQLIGWPQKPQRRANFVQVFYENSVVSAEFGAKDHGTFCTLPHNAL